MTAQKSRPAGSKRVGAIAVGLVGLAAVYFAFGTGGEAQKKSASASAPIPPAGPPTKPLHTMNLALGDMVVLAPDLGFSIATAKNTSIESKNIVLRIESHLQRLREIYRQESSNNAALAGSIAIQFKISPSGEVSDVAELWSRISDAGFKTAVLSEAARWSFADVVSEPLTVTCPLLFVRQGMDITTLVRWEKSLAKLAPTTTPSDGSSARSIPAPTEKKAPVMTAAKTIEMADQRLVRYSTSLRKRPDFSSDSLTVISAGTRLTVLGKAGDWFEVRLSANGPSGYIRKEFVKPVEVAGE